MYTKMKKIWIELNQNIVVNKRELVLGITTCTMAGILLGIVLSPRKHVTIGSNNGNNNTGNPSALPQESPVPTSEQEEAEV